MNEKVRKESPLASMLWKFMLFVGLLLGGTSQLYAQQSQVTGSIVDAEGEAMIGVSVKVKGASHGTISDMDGHFCFLTWGISHKISNGKDNLL